MLNDLTIKCWYKAEEILKQFNMNVINQELIISFVIPCLETLFLEVYPGVLNIRYCTGPIVLSINCNSLIKLTLAAKYVSSISTRVIKRDVSVAHVLYASFI